MRYQKLMALAPFNSRVLAAQSAVDLGSFFSCRRASPGTAKSICSTSRLQICRDSVTNPKQIFNHTVEKAPVTMPMPLGFELRKQEKSEREIQQEITLNKLQEIEDKISRMATKLETLSHVSEVQMKINRVNLSYTSGKLVTLPRDRKFRSSLMEAYGYSRFMRPGNIALRCPVIDHPVPASHLIAAHIFKHEWGRVAESVLGVESVDSPENGMMLFSPIEYCFDRLQLCLLYNPEEVDELVCHVLDPELLNKSLVSVAAKRGNWKGTEDETLSGITFGDIDGRKLKFMTRHRPLREAVNFHARQARLHAISRRWIDESWDFQDFYTDEARWNKLKIWIEQTTDIRQ